MLLILRRYVVTCLILCFWFILTNQSNAQQRYLQVQEVWQELYLYGSLGDRTQALVLFNNLYNSDIGYYDWFVEGSIKHKFNNWMAFETMFRQEYFRYDEGWTYEQRPMARLSLMAKVGSWKLRNRHRIEIRTFEFGPTRFRYRNDLRIKASWNLTPLNLNPFWTEEMFVNDQQISRIRSYVGVLGSSGRWEPMIYALVQSDQATESWIHVFITGFGLGIRLNQ